MILCKLQQLLRMEDEGIDQQCFDVKEDSGCFISKLADIPGEDEGNCESRVGEFEAKVSKVVASDRKGELETDVGNFRGAQNLDSVAAVADSSCSCKPVTRQSRHGSIIGCHDQYLKSSDLETDIPGCVRDIELNIPLSDYEDDRTGTRDQCRVWSLQRKDKHTTAQDYPCSDYEHRSSGAGQHRTGALNDNPPISYDSQVPQQAVHGSATRQDCSILQTAALNPASRTAGDPISRSTPSDRHEPWAADTPVAFDEVRTASDRSLDSRTLEAVQEDVNTDNETRVSRSPCPDLVHRNKIEDEEERESMGSKSSDSLPRSGKGKRDFSSPRRGHGKTRGSQSLKSGKRVSFRLRHER